MKKLYAYWKDGIIYIAKVNGGSGEGYRKIEGMHEAATEIQEMIKIGLVRYGILEDKLGQKWNENMQLLP